MYTQCPDCNTAFRVAADDLRQAAGKVRCGDCGAAFDALLYLSEDMPEPDSGGAADPVLPELKHKSGVDKPKLPETISANESIALLQTLDELAGSDVRIEDTGIEWRVLDEVAMSAMGTDEAPSDDQPDQGTEVRYDDDSPLPDEPASDKDETPEDEPDSITEETTDDSETELSADNIDVEEIDDSGDWEAILEDMEEPATERIGDNEVGGEELVQSDNEGVPDGDDQPTDESPEASPEETGDDSEDESHEKSADAKPVDDEPDDDEPDDETRDDSHDEVESALEDDPASDIETVDDEAAVESVASPDEDSSPSQWQLLDEDQQEDSIPTLIEPQEPAAEQDLEGPLDDDAAAAAEDFGVESIVLEGDTVSIALEDSEAAASVLAAAEVSDFGATVASPPPPPRSASRRGGLMVVAILLLAALGLQAVHQQRHALARIPAVNSIIGPLYESAGKRLAPAWDVAGWSFEATTGKAEGDDEQLNIYTRIGNRSDEAMPYPLIGVSLTDRYEEIIGSRVVEPSGYLPSNVNPRKRVAPGETFEAFIAVQSPDMVASGYKLDVCYRQPDRRLRCAIGDFR